MGEQKHTAFAMQALGFADLFNIKVGDQPVLGRPDAGLLRYRVELSAPEGISTGGGKQSVQHIKLVPDGQEGGVVLVAGSADPVEKSAEIRTFDYLAEVHAKRFKGARIPLEKGEYEKMVRRAHAFLQEMGMRVVLLEAVKPVGGGAMPAPSGKSGTSTGALVAIVVVVVALVAGAFLVVSKSKSKHAAPPAATQSE